MAYRLRGLLGRQPCKIFVGLCVFLSTVLVLSRLYTSDEGDLLAAGASRDSPELNQLCAAHGFTVHPAATATNGSTPRKIFDLTMINTELDWLEIRLDTLYNEVDLFIIVESPKTFHGHEKPLLAKQSWDRFVKYHDKMLYHELEFPGGFRPQRTWDFEYFQRDASYEQVFPKLLSGSHPTRAPRLGDVMIVADVDEIPRPETLRVLRACNFPRRLTLFTRFYYYSFQFLSIGPEWHHPQATYYDGPKTLSPNDLRRGTGGTFVSRWLDAGKYANSGWHCSSCFDSIELYLNKMASFSHKWMNGDKFRDRDRIADAVREGMDIWGRQGNNFERVQDNWDLPPIVVDDARFMYLKDRSGKSAGMKDYP